MFLPAQCATVGDGDRPSTGHREGLKTLSEVVARVRQIWKNRSEEAGDLLSEKSKF